MFEVLEKGFDNVFPGILEIPEQFRLEMPVIQTEFLINGELLEWNGAMQDVVSPVCLKTDLGLTQAVIGKYPKLTEKESLMALDAAVSAYDNGRGLWPTMSVLDRIKHLEDFAYRMKEVKKEVVNLLMWEIGKSFADSEKEFDRTVEYIVDTIEAVKDLDRNSSRLEIEAGVIAQIRRAPLGVVLCMGPFNYPLNETYTTLIPAIIMGNTVVFKPPKVGVLLHRPLLKAFKECFPKGVVNTVYGSGQTIIPPLMQSNKVNALAFIGTSKVGDSLKKQHPNPHRMRSILGLEAKNPAIILPDADIDLTVKECVLGTLSFNGQRCTALKMLFVQKYIYDAFMEKFVPAVENLKVGMPWDKDVQITPLPEDGKSEFLRGFIEDAEKHGAKIINPSGGKVNKTVFFPAIISPVNSNMRLYREEQFGPIIPIIPFDDINTPINYVIESNYGQQVSIFGKNEGILAELIDSLVNQVCRVNINSQCQRGPDKFPFTGRKDSAEGTLSVTDALRVFSIRTLVAAKDSEINKKIITTILRERKSTFLSTDFIL